MMEHWPTIVSVVAVGGMTIFVRSYYVPRSELEKFKAECEKMRTNCQVTTCKLIQSTRDNSTEKTDVLTLGARNNVAILNKIREELTNLRIDVGALTASLDQFLKDKHQ